MNMLVSLTEQIRSLSAANPMVAGALSLWGLTVVTWLIRKVPARIVKFIFRHTTTSIVFNNAGWGGNRSQFARFMDWFASTSWFNWSRTLSADAHGQKMIFGPGFGLHFFIHNRRLFWFRKLRLESTGSEGEKEQIYLYTLGRSAAPIINVMNEFEYKHDKLKLRIYHYSIKDSRWELWQEVRKRSFDTVIINASLKDNLKKSFDHFLDNRSWYEDRGLAYKATYILHGVPGTGKTSIISALASHFDRVVCLLNLSSMSDESLAKAMSSLPKDAMVLIEDFDSHSAVLSRKEDKNQSVELPPDSDDKEESSPARLTLSQILNTLDGLVRLDDVVIVMTTNHLEKIDSALLRKGRVDHIVEICPLQDTEIRAYIKMMYPLEHIDASLKFSSIVGCDIQGLYLEHKENYSEFIRALPLKE